jgi:hypothetical protein
MGNCIPLGLPERTRAPRHERRCSNRAARFADAPRPLGPRSNGGRFAMKFVVLTFAVLLTGCDAQLGSDAAIQAQLASLNQRMATLDARMSAFEQTNQQDRSPGNWVLYYVSEALNSGYAQAWSAYPSKADCLTAAAAWSFPGGKMVAQDPVVIQMKGYRIRLECLPVGTTPYAH